MKKKPIKVSSDKRNATPMKLAKTTQESKVKDSKKKKTKAVESKAIADHFRELFGGKEVPMRESSWERTIFDKCVRGVSVELENADHPILHEMSVEAKKHNLILRIGWPHLRQTCDDRIDRMNARIEKSKDGKWRVASSFYLG